MDWHVLDPFGAKLFGHEQIERLIADGSRYFVKYKNGVDINYGVSGEAELDAYKSHLVFSIAHAIATHSLFKGATVLVLLINNESEDDDIFAVGLVSGNIVLDAVCSLFELSTVYEKFAADCEKAGRSFTVWGDATPDGVTADHTYSLTELLDQKGAKKAKIEHLKNDRTVLMMVVGVIAMVLILVMMGAWDWYRNHQKLLLDQLRQSQSSPSYLYTESVKNLLASPQRISAICAPQIISQVGSFPAKMAGWSLNKIMCQSDECEAHWNSQGGTYDDFKKAAPAHWGQIALTNNEKDVLGDLKTIRHTFKLELKAGLLPERSQWPKAYQFSLDIGNQWQHLSTKGWASTLKPIEQQAIPVGVQPAAVKNHPQAIYAMPWHAVNQNWQLAKEVIASFPANVVLTKFEVQVNPRTGITFGADGLAYVQP